MQHTISYAAAISEAISQAMEMDNSVFLVGQGTRDKSQIFGSVEGLFEKFGSRVVEMPISEGAITGLCVGAALQGLRPILVLQRADFSFLILDQVLNHAAKYHFMFGGQMKVPLTVRLIVGKGWGQGPQHSQSLHSMYAHFPGLRVVAPTDPYTAKGILLNSIFSDDPVVIFEGRSLYQQTQDIPQEPYTVAFARAQKVMDGDAITIVAVSFLVPEAIAAACALREKKVSAEVIDLVSINPLDIKTITDSVTKTGRLLIVDTSWAFCGISAEISAQVNELAFEKLKTPVRRLTIPFCPTPAAERLEKQFYPHKEQILECCLGMLREEKKERL